jgi:hypothetical protein
MEDLLLFVAKTYIHISIVEKSTAKMVGHASKSMNPISKSKANDMTCHPIFSGQDCEQICVANFGFLCDGNCFI